MLADYQSKVGSLLLAVGVLVALLACSGCQTDSLVGPAADRDPPEGPVDSLEFPAGYEIPPIPIVGRTEADLVEEMILHRAQYARFLRALATFYSENGNDEKATWARAELSDLRRFVKPYRYITDAEVPVATLRPEASVAEADNLYDEGVSLMKKGGSEVPGLYNQATMKLALAKFKELVERYPSSDKIDDAAFQIAELHKEYFEEKDNSIAIAWYQRAIDWNPNLPYPARFQMAAIYDYRMHEREKALAMYQEVLEKETFNKSNVEFAHARIRQFTAEKTRYAPGETTPGARPEPSGSPEPAAEPTAAVPVETR